MSTAANLPSTWLSRGGEGMGEYGILTMWSWPTDFLYGLGGKLGLSFDFLERVLGGLLAIFIGVYALQKLLKKYDIEGLPAFVATLFYLTTTYFILLLDGGQFLIALASSFMPLAFYFDQKFLFRSNFFPVDRSPVIKLHKCRSCIVSSSTPLV